MGDYTGGVTSALDSRSRRGVEDAQAKALLQQIMQAQQVFQQQQEQQKRQQQAKAMLGDLLPQLAAMGPGAAGGGPQPQPPMPGQPSVPMTPPGMPSMPPQPGPAAGPMPGMPPQGGAPPAPMPSMPPPPAQGQGAPMAKAGGPGAPMPGAGGPPAGAAPPMPPQPWQSLPKPPEAAPAGLGGLPPPPEDAVMPKQLISVSDLSKLLAAKGIKGTQAMDMIEQWKPYMDSQNKAELDAMKVQNTAQAAALRAYTAVVREAETRRHHGVLEQQGDTRLGQGQQRISIHVGDGKSEPIKPETIDYYARQSLAGDNSWQVGLARGKVGQKLIQAVKDRIPELAKESGVSPEEASAAKATRESLSATLKDRQKFLGTATQFVSNFQKQADLVDKYMKPGLAGSVPVFNKWIQAGRKALAGDPDVTALDTAIRGLGREHQRIVTGLTSNAQLHIAAQETADELLNKDMTAEQIKSTLGVMREEAQNALDAGKTEIDFLTSQIKHLGVGGKSAAPTPAAGKSKGDYVELRTTKDGRTLGKKADGTVEVVQ